MTDWYVGQKVVCIKAEPWVEVKHGRGYAGPFPQLNAVYTITRIYPYQDEVFFLLGELGFAGFGSGRFRPVVESKTDISIFTRLLDRANAGELERA